MVGALADWFAVTALFRHPLGLPIPHTAIIPKRKDQIGRSLGEFVEGNFLTREVLRERLHGLARRTPARRVARRARARRAGLGASPATAMKGVIEVLDDRDVQSALGSMVERRLRQVDVAPLLAEAVDVSVAGGHHQRLLDAILRGPAAFLDEQPRRTLASALQRESPWWVPEPIDDRIFNKIFGGVQRFLGDVAGAPITRCGGRSRSASCASPTELRTDPEMIAKVTELRDELLSHPEVQAWLESLWGAVKRAMLDATGDPTSEIRVRRDSPGCAASAPAWRRRRAAGEARRLARAHASRTSWRTTTSEVADLIARPSSVGTATNVAAASSCRSARTSSSSASTARSSAASPASASTPSANCSSDGAGSVRAVPFDYATATPESVAAEADRALAEAATIVAGATQPGAERSVTATLLPLDHARGHRRGDGQRRFHGVRARRRGRARRRPRGRTSASSAGPSTCRSTRRSPPR